MDKKISIFNAEIPSDFCKCVEDLLKVGNQKSFKLETEFINDKGVVYDVKASYIRRDPIL